MAPHEADPKVPPSSVLRPCFRCSSLESWQNLSRLLLGRINDRMAGLAETSYAYPRGSVSALGMEDVIL